MTTSVSRSGNNRESERSRAVTAYVERIVDSAPAFTREQRDLLAVLLLGGSPPREVVRRTPEAEAAA
jgi:hypothetical protein